jgi:hypothetical protein
VKDKDMVRTPILEAFVIDLSLDGITRETSSLF